MQDNVEYREYSLPRAGAVHSQEAVKFLNTVYLWMFIGLALTSVVSWVVMSDYNLLMTVAPYYLVLCVAELLLVVVLSAAIRKISAGAATILFLVYSALNGVTLALIMAIYTGESVTMAFLSAACLFGTMTLYGYITKRDLTGIGRLLGVGLIALIVCMIINMFLGSSGFSFLISAVGIAIFLGLTAYDTQKILKLGSSISQAGPGWYRKAAIIGALELYLDFINLFLFMLRIFGKRR